MKLKECLDEAYGQGKYQVIVCLVHPENMHVEKFGAYYYPGERRQVDSCSSDTIK
jgi:hypothetical protein